MEETNNINDYIEKFSSPKLAFSYLTSLIFGILYNNSNNINNQSNNEKDQAYNPFLKLLSNYEEIKKIMKLQEPNKIKFIYYNRNKVHNILYDEEEMINIDNFKTLSFNFYLSLLIRENPYQINYSYSIDFIKELNNLQQNNKKKYQRIIRSKIIIELIKNYESLEFYDEEKEKEELKKIENSNEEILKKFDDENLNIKKEDLISKNIDRIYIEIINELMKKMQKIEFEDYKFVYDIITELDLENIDITSEMINNLNNNLKYNENIMINNVEDLSKEKKINFNYILLKYLLKHSIYIYQNATLIKNRKNIIEILKSEDNNLYTLLKNKNIKFKDKIKFIIKRLTDSEYYLEQYIFKRSEDAYKILKKSSFVFQNNKIGKSKFILNYKIKKDIDKKEKILDFESLKTINLPKDDEKLVKSFKKFLEFFPKFQKCYEKNIDNKYNNNININLEFSIKEEDEENNNLYNMKLRYRFKKFVFEDLDILNSDFDLNSAEGFRFLLNEIKENYYSQTNDEISTNINSNSTNNSIITKEPIKEQIIESIEDEKKEEYDHDYLNTIINELLSKENKYQIISFNSNIKSNKKAKEFLVEAKNGIFISAGIDNELYLFNSEEKIKIIEIKEEKVQNNDNKEKQVETKTQNKYNEKEKEVDILMPLKIYENNKDNENEKFKLIICTKIGLISMEIKTKDFSYRQEQIKIAMAKQDASYKRISCSTYLEIDNDHYIIGGEEGIFKIFQKESDKKVIKIIEGAYIGGIKIDDKNIAFTSNSALPNGDNKLIIYKIESDSIIKEIEIKGHSFTISRNSLVLMKNMKNNKILLCGCKKYLNYQKNGILIIYLQKNSYKEEFYDTEDFEVYCFLPITYKKEDKEVFHTDYFLVGGFCQKKNQGMIKLYKIIKNVSENRISIEFKQDITFPNDFSGFERNVSCITQSKNNENLFVTCWDGNIYKFTPPNIGYYLHWDQVK